MFHLPSTDTRLRWLSIGQLAAAQGVLHSQNFGERVNFRSMKVYPELERAQGLVPGQVLALQQEQVQGLALVQAPVLGLKPELRAQHKTP